MRARVFNLAKEIGAEFKPEHEGRPFQVAWVKKLAEVVGSHTWPMLHRYPEDVIAWAKQICAADSETLALESVLKRVREEIHGKDYDDGWANDKAGSAMESVCLALQPNTRWLAEAGKNVWNFATGCSSYNSIVKISQDAWLRHVYAKCCIRPLERELIAPAS